jgi:hypothetical protein
MIKTMGNYLTEKYIPDVSSIPQIFSWKPPLQTSLQNPLINAVYNGSLEDLKRLINEGYDPTIGVSFQLARYYGTRNKFKIDFNVDSNICVRNDGTLLEIAAINGHRNIVEFLIKDPNVKLNNAMSYAAVNGHRDIVEYILERESFPAPDRDVFNSTIYSAFNSAFRNDYHEIVEMLIKYVSISSILDILKEYLSGNNRSHPIFATDKTILKVLSDPRVQPFIVDDNDNYKVLINKIINTYSVVDVEFFPEELLEIIFSYIFIKALRKDLPLNLSKKNNQGPDQRS